jgi:hypothetical protein
MKTDKDNELKFIWQRSGEAPQWRNNQRNVVGHNIEDNIHCAASNIGETR